MRIEDVEGIGPVYAGKLEAAGVKSTDDLLERGAKPSGRHALEEATGSVRSELRVLRARWLHEAGRNAEARGEAQSYLRDGDPLRRAEVLR